MRDLLKLTRPLNLAIIALTMLSMRAGVINAFLEVSTSDLQQMAGEEGTTLFVQVPDNVFHHQLSAPLFWLLVLSTVLIAAGGNVINDYFDTRIDRINKPGQVIVGRTVKRRVAMAAHFVLSGAGVLLGLMVAWRTGLWKWAAIPVFAAFSLWAYSTSLKRRFVIGNGLVALLTALVPLTVGLYEIPLLARAYAINGQVMTAAGEMQALLHVEVIWPWILGYALLAFMSTLIRELQKDMADVKGDEADGCRTVPIVLGMRWARIVTLAYIAVLVASVLSVRQLFLKDTLSFWFIGVGVVVPLLLSGGFTFNATDRRGFTIAGNLMKAAMVAAVGYAWLIRYTL